MKWCISLSFVVVVSSLFFGREAESRGLFRRRSTCCCTRIVNCHGTNNSIVAKPPVVPRANAVHCLFITGNNDATIAAALDRGTNEVKRLFQTPGLREKVVSNVSISGPEATPQNILAACDALTSGPDDTIFVFYQGHGAISEQSGHNLLPLLKKKADGSVDQASLHGLPRTEVLDKLKTKHFRFLCFVTDACSEIVDLPQIAERAAPHAEPPIVSLMLDNSGILDVNSCSYDKAKGLEERAWITKDGGIFTQAFVRLGQGSFVDDNGDGKVLWRKEYLPQLAKATDEQFQRMKKDPKTLAADATIVNQDHQTVQLIPHDEAE